MKNATPPNESLCNHCGKCCYKKIIVGRTVYITPFPCEYLDTHTNLCTIYERRHELNPNCLSIESGMKHSAFPGDCPYVPEHAPPNYKPAREDYDWAAEWDEFDSLADDLDVTAPTRDIVRSRGPHARPMYVEALSAFRPGAAPSLGSARWCVLPRRRDVWRRLYVWIVMATPDVKIFAVTERSRRAPRIAAAIAFALIACGVLLYAFLRPAPQNQHESESALIPPPTTEPAKHATNDEAPPPPDRREVFNAIREHLLLHLPFTSSLSDHSPHGRTYASTGAIEVHDGAAHFPGDAYMQFPHVPLDNRPFSFAVWIRPEGKIVGYGLLEQSGGGPGKLLHILMRDPDLPYFGFFMNDLRASEHVLPEVWTHLVFQFTGTRQQIWINGQLAAERPAEPYLGESGDTMIGKAPNWSNVPTRFFMGAMRDLRLYDIVLTQQQIRLLAGLDANTSPSAKKPTDIF